MSEDIVVSEGIESEPKTKPPITRNPYLAGLMSLFIPGLGQMYNGQTRTLIFILIAWLGGTNLHAFLLLYTGIPVLWPFLIVLPYWAVWNAYKFAKKFDLVELEGYQRPQYYILVVAFVVSGYFPVLGIPLNIFGTQAFRIPTGGMENTLLVGDYIVVDTRCYNDRGPQTGDVVVFRYPRNPEMSYVKRCVAGPGRTVQIVDGRVLVDSQAVLFPPTIKYTQRERLPKNVLERGICAVADSDKWNHDQWGPAVVEEDFYFMMGDNRDNSADSRYWGPISKDAIIGKARKICFSWDKSVSFERVWDHIRWNRIARSIY